MAYIIASIACVVCLFRFMDLEMDDTQVVHSLWGAIGLRLKNVATSLLCGALTPFLIAGLVVGLAMMPLFCVVYLLCPCLTMRIVEKEKESSEEKDPEEGLEISV